MTDTPVDLVALKALREQRTKGEWCVGYPALGGWSRYPDLEFIAHVCGDGGYLDQCVAEIERLRAVEAAALALCHEWDGRAFYKNHTSNYATELRDALARSRR
jgi:hypothetical protein